MDVVENFQHEGTEGTAIKELMLHPLRVCVCVCETSLKFKPQGCTHTHGFLTSVCVCLSEVLVGCSFSAWLHREPPCEPFISPVLLYTGPDPVSGCLEGRWKQRDR